MSSEKRRWTRRTFLQAGATVAAATGLPARAFSGAKSGNVTLLSDPADPIANTPPVLLAVQRLSDALHQRGVAVRQSTQLSQNGEDSNTVLIAGFASEATRRVVAKARVSLPSVPEALALINAPSTKSLLICALGNDPRGLVYAVTELTGRVQNDPYPLQALFKVENIVQQPANQVRSLTRLFCSEPEDKPWFNDREMWPQYFDNLVAQRFNRFNLAFGIGYDFIRKVTDAYFLFTYPFLLNVPGYSVRASRLPDAERDRNLEMLKFIGEQCVLRGLEFHVGLWMHGYVWIDSPEANYTIEGLDKTTHGPYCRDAVRLLLQQVPTIQGLTFRIHGESGVEEGSFEFWKTVFDGVKTCGRRVPIDMHPKGMSQSMIDIALATGQPLQMSPKFWGEHMGLPYHQADIRALEKPKAEDRKGLMALSDGTRSFLRYGYGDLLPENRRWTVVHRIWPGTQRVLLWGDPEFASAYSRAFSFCGSNGVEIQEMLSFKGRRGSGHAGDRCAYKDPAYRVRWDWQKYEYGTRVWGHMLYDPETKLEVVQRPLRKQFGAGAVPLQSALAHVSRILPMITTAYAPSAGNNTYWPELYLNQSMVDAEHVGPYRDSPQPQVFGMASPFDPELFYTIHDFATDLMTGQLNGKCTPSEVATWIEGYASAGRQALSQAEASAQGRGTGAYKRTKVDVQIQAGLGEFFGAKLRSGVLLEVYRASKSRVVLEAAIAQYKRARTHWEALAQVASPVYMSDITLGEEPQLRGHWVDRIPAIDRDIAALEALLPSASSEAPSTSVNEAMQAVLSTAPYRSAEAHHAAPSRFESGKPLELTLTLPDTGNRVLLRYRHVDQAENYQQLAMAPDGAEYKATIPADYTNTEYPLEYFFIIQGAHGHTGLYPGFAPEPTNQPYFVVRST